MLVNTTAELVVIDLLNPGQSVLVNATNVPNGDIGMDYEPVGGSVIGYDGSLHKLDIPANYRDSQGNLQQVPYNWVPVTEIGQTSAPNPQGTYGRFRYIPAIKAFAVINDVNGPLWVYKVPQQGL